MNEPRPLHAGDVVFLDVESEVYSMQLGACLLFDAAPLDGDGDPEGDPEGDGEEATRPARIGKVDFEGIVDFIESRLAEHARYRQRVATTPVERRPIWVDVADFDVRRHVVYERLAMGSDEQTLKARCADFVAEPLDPAHPLWAIRVIEGFARDRFALAVKAHHCLVDGVAGITLLQSLLRPEPRRDFEKNVATCPAEAPGRGSLLLAELRDRARGGRDLAREALDTARRPGRWLDRALDDAIGALHVLQLRRRPASPTPLETSMGSPRRRLDWMETGMDRIREITRARGGTVNDVVIATVALALGRFLEAQGISRDEQAGMELRVAIPVDRRPDRHRQGVGNRISMMFARIPTEERDPLRVLDRTRRSLAVSKQSHVADALDGVLDLAEWTPRFLTRPLTRRALRTQPANLVVTNVRGPAEPLYLLESRMQASYPIVPLMPGQTLAIAVMSYAGKLYWGLHADAEHFPSLGDWCEELERAFGALHDAVMRPMHPEAATAEASGTTAEPRLA